MFIVEHVDALVNENHCECRTLDALNDSNASDAITEFFFISNRIRKGNDAVESVGRVKLSLVQKLSFNQKKS